MSQASHATSAHAPEPALEFACATLGYGEARILGCVELEVQSGEIVGLVGPNGAGKTTLLRAVTGSADVISGHLLIAGTPAEKLSSRERALNVGVVPQSVSAAFSFSAREFVAMGRHPHLRRLGQPGEHDRAVVERALDLTDTVRLGDEPVDTLSGGDLQRLALAQALAQEPRLLLLDEPTSHLDLNHRLQVLDLVRDLADAGLAVLAVFHDLDLAARYADRIAVVAGARVERPGPPAAIITPDVVREVFGVRAVVGTDPVSGTVSVTPVLREEAVRGGGEGRVMVVGGSGNAAALMRRLTVAGFDVVAAALNLGDVDEGVAAALDLERVTLPPYESLDATSATRVGELARSVDAIVVSAVPFGGANLENLRVATRAGKPLVLVGDIEGRDFTGGEATRLWREAAQASSTTRAADDGAAEDAVRAVVAAMRRQQEGDGTQPGSTSLA